MENLTKNQRIIAIIIIIVCIIIICFYVYGKNNNYEEVTNDEILANDTNETKDIDSSEKKDEESEKIIVHIMGAVKNAGVVELNENSRISDAIDAAGGITEDADMSKINLAYMLEDGMKIIIPSINDKTNEQETTDDSYITTDSGQTTEKNISNKSESKSKNELININKASQTELETLPGIGASTASKIIAYRDENGKFSKIEDIKNVSGIGDSKYETIKKLICV